MVHLTEACDECTQNCLLMHKKKKNPSPVVTTFFKVMFGDDYSKILFLPQRFAHSMQNMVGKVTRLEDLNGEKWKVKLTKVDGLLAFKEGWDTFSLAHGLKVGDFLVFHYIMESHFVVLMYGQSGCPEIRHFGSAQHQLKETSKNPKLINVDHNPSNLKINSHRCSYESSSQSDRSVYGVNERSKKRNSVGTQRKREKNKKKTSQNVSTLNPNEHITGPTDSDKETCQISDPLVRNTDPDNMVSETPTMKQHVEDESNGVRKNNVGVGGGGDKTKSTLPFATVQETRPKELRKKQNESSMMPSEPTCNNSVKRSRSVNLPTTQAKMAKIELVLANETDQSGSRLHNASGRGPSARKPTAAKPMDEIKKEITTNCDGSDGRFLKNSFMEKYDILPKVKPEPVDYDEAPPSGAANKSFSAVMSSYKYLELPEWVKLRSKVILLRNGADLWPVLYQNKLGVKALTRNWELFAREKGFKPGDKCEFVLESGQNSHFTCNVFKVGVT